jgi:hypothetical protein
MSYDRTDWHYAAENYAKDIPRENGGTHIGMFLAWAIMNGLEGDEHHEDCPTSLAAVRARQMTGRQFLFRECDEKFTDADLSDEGNAFARYYYGDPEWHYLKDYDRVLASNLPSTYHVEDTWENYDKIATVISQRFDEWKRTR